MRPRQRRAPTVERRPGSPFWFYRFKVGGIPYKQSTKCTNQKEAQAVADEAFAQAIADAEARRRSGREPMTVETAVAKWWEEVGIHLEAGRAFGPVDPGNPHYAKRPLNWLIRELGPATPLHAITISHVSDLVAKRRRDLRSVGRVNGKTLYRPVANGTVNHTVTKLLRRIMLTARDKWRVHIPEMPQWGSLKLPEKRNKPRILKVEEQAVLDQFERPELRTAREFALLTGLRLAEIVSIRWPDVNFADGTIAVIQKGNEPRTVVMDGPTEALLRSLQGHHPEWVFTYAAKQTRYNPPTGETRIKGQRYRLTAHGLTSARNNDWKKAGIKATFHDLRRTAANVMWQATGRIEAAQLLLGHSDVQTTKIYLDAHREHAEIRAMLNQRNAHVAQQWEAAGGKPGAVPALQRRKPRRA